MRLCIVLVVGLLCVVNGKTAKLRQDNGNQKNSQKDLIKQFLDKYYQATSGERYMYGHCVVRPNSEVTSANNQITGSVNFRQPLRGGPTEIQVSLTGFDTADSSPLHGFHIHEYGDLNNGCSSAGSHYNPFGVMHGSPRDSPEDRHFGDLGNVREDGNGCVTRSMDDKLVTLFGPYSILGRAIVIHAGEDDVGRGDDLESLKTGNAGSRLACCTIGLSDGTSWKY